jgi:OmcA/MtrC family decaheme c-type cytochrome
MKLKLVRMGTAALAAVAMALAGCGGGGGGGDGGGSDSGPQGVQQALAAAAAQPSNDTSTNPTAAFTVLQGAGVPAVTVNSAPKVNFTVFSDGAVKQGLALSNVSLIIAKLVPGTNGEPDKWVSYTYRTESTASGANNTGPGGKPVLASALQATTDTKLTGTSTAALTQLVYHPDGYYTYTFSTDITDPTKTQGVTFEPNRTHRVAIQLSYTNAKGATVRVNPYFDFTIGANGKSVPVTDTSLTRKMVDIGTCNGCHDELRLHGGGRKDTQFCVMCHNPSTVDAQSGNNLNFATMVHKIHSGRELHEHGENYVIWGNAASKHDYSEVGFPQPTRNCAACHTGSNPLTPQGDNWKSKPTKEACLSCHQSGSNSPWFAAHVTTLKLGPSAAAISNSTCGSCHGANSSFSPEKAHWVQELANASLYKGVIESVTVTKAPTATATGTARVKYAVINPATGAAYNLREGCSQPNTTDQAGTAIVGCNSNYRWDAQLNPANYGNPPDKFGTFTLGLATNTLAQTLDDTTGTAGGILPAYRGVQDATNRYTMDITIPAGSKGNARLLLLGSVSELRLDPLTRAPSGAFPPKKNGDLAYVPVKNDLYEFTVTGTGARATTTARRQIVSNDNCNSCHGILGLPTGPNEPERTGFHKGVRNNSEGCVNCHNANQSGGYTLMTDGSTGPVAGDSQLQPADNKSSFLHESYHAKRFIHGIHAGSKRVYPFTHCLTTGGVYNKDGTSTTGGKPLGNETCYNYPGETLNFTAEVAYPAQLGNCANCHVKDSWKQDKSVIGSVVFKPTGVTNMLDWYVISPKAATCTSCHDSKAVQTHVKTVGASFGTATQNDLLNKGTVFESCEGCHAPGSAIGVDTVHGFR